MELLAQLLERCPIVAKGIESGKLVVHFLLETGDVVEAVISPPH